LLLGAWKLELDWTLGSISWCGIPLMMKVAVFFNEVFKIGHFACEILYSKFRHCSDFV